MSDRRSVALIAAGLLFVAVFIGMARRSETTLAFLAVGQGDAAFFQSSGRALLFDVGPAGAGNRVVVPYLRRMGVKKLDMVMLSHPDSDHIAALPEIARAVRIVKVVAPLHFQKQPDLVAILSAAQIGPDRIAWVAGPSQARFGTATLYMDVPPWVDGQPDNDGSLMAKMVQGQASATLTGDAGFEEEIQAMAKGSWTAQILKLGHHGSRYSTGDSWLDHVAPEIAIVSCGRDNNYGHPATEVLERCATRGIRMMRTDREGNLSFRIQNGKFVRVP